MSDKQSTPFWDWVIKRSKIIIFLTIATRTYALYKRIILCINEDILACIITHGLTHPKRHTATL